jgi:alpha-tubulin suppressor-like RCC1 family protein
LACWGKNDSGQSTPPAGKFTQVSAGQSYTCGIKSDESVTCWGENDSGQSTPPAGRFTQVSAGLAHACGVKTDGTATCWGGDSFGEGTPPTGTFIQVSTGNFHTCGLRPDGSIVCWGANALSQSTPPAGAFRQVSAGAVHTCGLKTDGTVSCWGNLGEEAVKPEVLAKAKNAPSTPPTKTAPDPHLVKKLAEENAKNAAILAVLKMNEGSHLASIFGDGSKATSAPSDSPPAGPFSQLSAGTHHTCGVKVDGSIICWSGNGSGGSNVRAGKFTQVSAGNSHTCGVKADGAVACWGSNDFGQSTPPSSAF